MASISTGVPSHPVQFTTQTQYPLPAQKFMIPSTWKRYQLSQLINKALSLPKPIPFDFLVQGEILRGSLGDWCTEKGTGVVCFRHDNNNKILTSWVSYRKKRSKFSISSLSCRRRKCPLCHMKIGYLPYHANCKSELSRTSFRV